MRPLFPEAVSRGTGAGRAGVLWTQPPEIGGAEQAWRCDHTHYDEPSALGCALAQLREWWAAEYLGLPEGWRAQVRTSGTAAFTGSSAERWGVLVYQPGHLLPLWMSQYRWSSPQAALAGTARLPGLALAVELAQASGREAKL